MSCAPSLTTGARECPSLHPIPTAPPIRPFIHSYVMSCILALSQFAHPPRPAPEEATFCAVPFYHHFLSIPNQGNSGQFAGRVVVIPNHPRRPRSRNVKISPYAKRQLVEFAQAFGAMLGVVAIVLLCVWVAS